MKKTTKKLDVREKKLVKAIVEGKTQVQAYEAAGYAVSGTNGDTVNATRKVNKPHIQQAIDDALESMGATPEWAVAQLMKVATQDEEIGAKRLAAKDILELHGWNKSDRPTVQLQVKNAFFGGGRNIDGPTVIEADQ